MTRLKKRTAACFSSSREVVRLELLSNKSASRTGVSERKRSLIGFGLPSTRSSKSSSLRLLTTTPLASTTDAGTVTRLELTLTTSPTSTSSESDLGFGVEETCDLPDELPAGTSDVVRGRAGD